MNDKEFYAVFIKSSYHVEGDERSLTNTGHGDPAHTVEYTEVKEFKTLKEFKEWVVENESSSSPKQYRAVECVPLKVTTKIEVDVKVSNPLTCQEK